MSVRNEDIMGICRACKEWTSITESCCNAPIWFEGGWEYPDCNDDNETEIENVEKSGGEDK